jgi:predicted membrane-bound spermidine synthase
LAISRWLRRYLYLTAAIAGGVVLIVEILGAKMLAPYFGASHFVWTAQIAVTLVSLAAGYYLGGWLADRAPRLGRLYACLLGAASYLCLAVLWCAPMAYACLRFRLALGALCAAILLFFVPLTLLATATPFLVRMLSSTVAGVGRQVGRLSAVSTLGSVAGTVLIGYVLIPFLPNSQTMYLTAGVLFAVVGVYFWVWGKDALQKQLIAIGILVGLAVGYGAIKRDRHASEELAGELYRGNSNFGMLQVCQTLDGRRRYYLTDFLIQNTYDPAEQKSASLFTYMLHGLARAYTPRLQDVLCVGLGVGIVPMAFAHEGAKVDVVEINPAVIPLAVRYFDLQTNLLNIIIGDGRHYFNWCAKQYDTIILDAFLGDSSPSHLLTCQAFSSMRRLLRPGGTLVINSFGDFEPGRDFFCASLHKTLCSVFPAVRIHDGGTGNVFFVASLQPDLKLLREPDLGQVHSTCLSAVKEAFASLRQVRPEAGCVLTDDFNPAEYYDATNREQLRRQLALSMR